jgi:peptidoglycan/xylan/chitin deacetylase (PgdA/CDA1 family)
MGYDSSMMRKICLLVLIFSMIGCRPLKHGEDANLLAEVAQPSPSQTQPFTPSPTATHTLTPTVTFTPTLTLSPTITLTPTLIPGPAPIFPPMRVTLIRNGDRELAKVALTFDVGEQPQSPAGFDEEIEQVLIDKGAAATFFLGGHWASRNRTITRRLAANPLFEIGNHSWSHFDFRELGKDKISREILKVNNLLYQLTGETTQLFRLPGGDFNDLAVEMIAFHGMYNIYWDVVTADPLPDNEADNINLIVQERVQNGSIIVMHANGRGWHTAEALPEMIDWLRGQGYELVTISDLLGLDN